MPDLTHLSYLGIVFVLILTGAGLPVPEEVPIVAAGVASSNQQLIPWLALGCCLVGAVVGDCVMYGIGFHFGRSLLRENRWFARILNPERERQIELLIARHGWKVFLLARFMVGLRSPVYLTAGILRVPFRSFLMVDSFCATLVVSVFFGLSYAYADHIETLLLWIQKSQYAMTATVVVAVVAVLLWFWWRRPPREKQPLEGVRGEPQRSYADAAASKTAV